MTTQPTVAEQIEGQTIPALLHRNAEEFGELPAVTSLDIEGKPTLNWRDFRTAIAEVSRGLAGLGLGTRDRMLIMAPSSPEHLIADLAAAHLGAIPCTAYATLSPEQIGFVARHSAAGVVVLAGADELGRWSQVLDDLPALRHIVVLDASVVPQDDKRFLSFADLRAAGAEQHAADPSAFETTWSAIAPDDPLSMIYTSGTTGDPKGVVLSHRNAIHQAVAVQRLHDSPMHATNIAYLPLAHIAERELSIYMPIVWAGHVHTVGDPSGVVGALGQVHPESFFGVPRVWEKMVAGLKNLLGSVPEDKRAALLGANELLQQGYKLRSDGKEVPPELAEKIARTDAAALAPVRAMLGLDQIEVASSGAAALPVEILYFIAGLGVEIQEVWGLSETTGAVTSNTHSAFKAGSVGRPLEGIEVKVAEDGELLVRGPIVFLGYLQEDGSIKPDVDADGWLATGDIGTIDERGFVTITDRKKELIITSSGKNIAPTKIEGLLKEHPLIGQAVAIGDDRPYVTALIVVDDEIAPGWATANGIELTEGESLADNAQVLAEIEKAVESANSRLARIEQIKRYHVIPKAWTPESGEVTPTLKLKRRIINDRYAPAIADLYAAAPEPAPAAGS
ncbi:AMP-dependent synthetase/ligase [Amycolatopsis regifaucium]|uniref:Acyl-CoA synthetase n=1 Tax=Amycolatopsis regifaucium TaxID=546365 RepID=A0A154MHC8_9PSEU|nr:AMP-dependent synthetase/ligase [Amycolatopsis regifaucium]KZB83805.1 AMP-dependent synthetase [Amycolatopsis regifaucium]OKA06754.1 long-chain fatty acid--CoA ligase [Amycolatopsis regifaucium]SFH26039.1 long-chain acyl-CoA synthetase [Amycolatopsis regifaucium]